ncbi:hypothetical protein CORC01_11789, partial [Colletotrichum orchidophilum]
HDQNFARYSQPFRFLDLPPELRSKIYETAVVCQDVVRVAKPPHKDTCACRKQLTIARHQNGVGVNPDKRPVAELLRTCKKIRHETSGMFFNHNTFGLHDLKTLVLWLEVIGSANRAVLRTLTIERDCSADLRIRRPMWMVGHTSNFYTSDPTAPRGDPYRITTTRVGELLSESFLLETLQLPCNYNFWQLPPLTIHRSDTEYVVGEVNIARRIAETLVEDFAPFFQNSLLLGRSAEQLSRVIIVVIINRKDYFMSPNSDSEDDWYRSEETSGHLNILLQQLQHKLRDSGDGVPATSSTTGLQRKAHTEEGGIREKDGRSILQGQS